MSSPASPSRTLRSAPSVSPPRRPRSAGCGCGPSSTARARSPAPPRRAERAVERACSLSTTTPASLWARPSPAPTHRSSCTAPRSRSPPACPSTSCGTRSPRFPPSARSGSACSRPTGCEATMPDVGFLNLFVVALVAFGVPLLLGLAPWLRVPGPVLEIVAGIVLGPAVLGWVDADLPVRVLAVVGLAFLLFLAGLEIDVQALRGRPFVLALGGFAITLVLGILVGAGFAAIGWVASALLLALTLSATSLGLVVPVLKDAGQTRTP